MKHDASSRWTRLHNVILALCIGLFAVGCSRPVDSTTDPLADIDFESTLAQCFQDPEGFPPAIAAVVEGSASVAVPIARALKLRQGYLQNNTAAQDRIYAELEPLDLIFVSIKHQLSGLFMSAYLNHMAVYLGTEEQLRARGMWDDPNLRPYHDQIRAGRTVIEANGDDVRLVDRAELFEIDAIAVFRQPAMTLGRQREILSSLAAKISTPFDFHYDVSDDSAIFCVELISVTMPELQLPVRQIYGRPTILPDEIVADALRGRNGLRFLGYIYGTPHEWGVGSRAMLGQVITRHWPT